jgi:hypothetical protein
MGIKLNVIESGVFRGDGCSARSSFDRIYRDMREEGFSVEEATQITDTIVRYEAALRQNPDSIHNPKES